MGKGGWYKKKMEGKEGNSIIYYDMGKKNYFMIETSKEP